VIPRDGATIFRDIVGKLDVLNVESDKGGRRGRYPAHRLVERYGMDAKLFDWSNKITAEASAKLERPVRRAVPRSVESCVMFGAPRARSEIAPARSGSRHDLVLLVGLGGRQGAGDPRPPLGSAPVGPRSRSPI